MAAVTKLPDPQEILSAPHLADMEAAYLAAEDEGQAPEPAPPLTLADATEALRRIRWHKSQIEADRAQADQLLAPLYEQIKQVEDWLAERVQLRERSISFHEARLAAYYRINPPAKGQTLKLPGGTVKMRRPAAKWSYGDETTLLEWLKTNAPQAVRIKEEVAKADLKRMVIVGEGGRAVLADTGEIVPEVTVVEQEPTFAVEVE